MPRALGWPPRNWRGPPRGGTRRRRARAGSAGNCRPRGRARRGRGCSRSASGTGAVRKRRTSRRQATELGEFGLEVRVEPPRLEGGVRQILHRASVSCPPGIARLGRASQRKCDRRARASVAALDSPSKDGRPAGRPVERGRRGRRPTLRGPTSAARAKLFSPEYQAVARPLLHEVGKVSGEARRMGCGEQECVVDGSLLWSRKLARCFGLKSDCTTVTAKTVLDAILLSAPHPSPSATPSPLRGEGRAAPPRQSTGVSPSAPTAASTPVWTSN